ncbi:hypothetical protein [Massilia sp. erpn]|uniref:hypothetical protein n=1 Tax=Massilia sp. erpn TaxID=2738142 RepID=UPI002105D702|nr:hypothetical protein [Massilia sp. erpn]UTY58917.1 hypothetical protein HPQ68_18045 [Massilia sp. erpn]
MEERELARRGRGISDGNIGISLVDNPDQLFLAYMDAAERRGKYKDKQQRAKNEEYSVVKAAFVLSFASQFAESPDRRDKIMKVAITTNVHIMATCQFFPQMQKRRA